MRHFYCLVDCQSLVITFLRICELLIKGSSFRSGHYPPLALCARSHNTLRTSLACSMLPTQPRSQGPLLPTPGVREDPGNEVGSPLSLQPAQQALGNSGRKRERVRERETRERRWSNDDFGRNTALQCWNNVVTIRNNIATTLQRCVALKIVVANITFTSNGC